MSNQTSQVNPLRRTWWVKLRRAEKHLSDVRVELRRLRENERPYDVVKSVETHHDVKFLVIRGHIQTGDKVFQKELEDFSALVGDFIFNVRSALDHICVALGNNDGNQFPIYETDIWKPDIDPLSRKDRNKSGRHGFKERTAGIPNPARAFIKQVQPYNTKGAHVEGDPLALLHHLSNADKHRRLLALAQYLVNPVCELHYPGFDDPVVTERVEGWQGGDGAIICETGFDPNLDPDVEARGGVEIGMKEVEKGKALNADWVLPGTLDGILLHVRDAIITPLDAMIP